MNLNCEFENKILNNLSSFSIGLKSKLRIGVAVSGGADSISLLTALNNILPLDFPLYVITVNHFIRSEKETTEDSDFVYIYSNELKKYRKNLFFSVVNLPKGKVFEVEKKLKCGIEDAARRLRYECFDSFITENNLDYLCLAHNKNDQIETLLMRFFQGSQIESLCGIPFSRDKFIRPLLNISRKEIEQYLSEKKISFRTDSTNFDTNYLRNKLRINVIPFLNEQFEGWQESIINGAQKATEDAKIIDSIVQTIPYEFKNEMFVIQRKNFTNQFEGIKRRLLLKAFDLLKADFRIPFVFLKEVIITENKLKFENKNEVIKEISNFCVIIKKDIIIVKKLKKESTDICFSAIIEEDGSYDFPFGKFSIYSQSNCKEKSIYINGFQSFCSVEYPFVIRNVQPDDYIKTSDNKDKKVLKIFSDWHVPKEEKSSLPIIQKLNDGNQPLICILGKAFGFYDWIVK